MRKLPLFNFRIHASRGTSGRRRLTVFSQRTFQVFTYWQLVWASIGALSPGVTIYIFEAQGFEPSARLIGFVTRLQDGPLIALIGLIVGLLGVAITAKVALFLSMRQHTMTMLSSHRLSEKLESHMNIIQSVFPVSDPVNYADAKVLMQAAQFLGMPDTTTSKPSSAHTYKAVYKSIIAVLNYYEFLAIGIKQRDLDCKVMHDFYAGMVCHFCDKVHGVILLCQQEFSDDYCNLVNLYLAWQPSNVFPRENMEPGHRPPLEIHSSTVAPVSRRFRRGVHFEE